MVDLPIHLPNQPTIGNRQRCQSHGFSGRGFVSILQFTCCSRARRSVRLSIHQVFAEAGAFLGKGDQKSQGMDTVIALVL